MASCEPTGRKLTSTSAPESLIDKTSDLHVLYQSGPREFDYCEISPRGQLLSREKYDLTASRPRLKPNASGQIAVIGGIRKARTDSPPPAASSSHVTPKSK